MYWAKDWCLPLHEQHGVTKDLCTTVAKYKGHIISLWRAKYHSSVFFPFVVHKSWLDSSKQNLLYIKMCFHPLRSFIPWYLIHMGKNVIREIVDYYYCNLASTVSMIFYQSKIQSRDNVVALHFQWVAYRVTQRYACPCPSLLEFPFNYNYKH